MVDIPPQAQQALQQVGDKVLSSGGGFLKGLVTSPFKAISGLLSGGLGGVLNQGLWLGAGLSALTMFAPDLVGGVLRAVGLGDIAATLGNLHTTGGYPALLAATMGTGMAAGGLYGGAREALGNVFGGGTSAAPEQSSGMSLGTVIGGGLVLAAGAAVAIGAFKKPDGIFEADMENGVQRPDVPPKPPEKGQNPAVSPRK